MKVYGPTISERMQQGGYKKPYVFLRNRNWDLPVFAFLAPKLRAFERKNIRASNMP